MTYRDDPLWKSIQTYLPVRNRITEEYAPEESFLSIGGMKIHIDHYRVPTPKARLFLFHGVGGNGRLLSCIAISLMKQGYEVICPDLPLYGYSEYQGLITYEHWVDCGIAIVTNYQKDTAPVFLFGFSAGGMLAYQIACFCPDIRGLLASCILDQREKEVFRSTARSPMIAAASGPLLTAAHRIAGRIRIPIRLVANMKAIANNTELASLLMRDKKSSGASVPMAFLYSMLHPNIAIEPEDFTACPFLLLHPEDDRWTDIRLSRLFYDRLACEKELYLLEGAGHFPIEECGLIQLEEHCIRFLEKHIPKCI